MTDHIPAGISPEEAKKAREWALHALNKPGASTTAEKAVARVVIGTVPEPRPTLADMTDEERAACQWMQCEVTGFQGQWVLATLCDDDDEAGLIAACGEICWSSPTQVTPRPDLPRLEWPGTGQDGEEATKVDYVSVAGGRTAYGPWTVARLRKKADPAPALPDGWRLADHKENGRVIVTNPTPNIEGRVYYVLPSADPLGYDWLFCTPDALTYLDQEADQ